MKLPPLRALQCFEAVARLNSFSKAAQSLHVSQSAVSHQVKLLEQYLGDNLFLRQGRSFSLTVVGQRYFEEVSHSLTNIANASQVIRHGQSGAVRLALYSSLAVKWLIPRLDDFHQQYPDIDLSLNMVTDDLVFDDQSTDCYITVTPPKRGFVSQFLYTEKLYPVCSQKLWQQIRDQPLPEALWQHPLLSVQYLSGSQGQADDWLKWCQSGGITLPDNVKISYFSHVLLATEAARYDLGITLIDNYLMTDQERQHRFVRIPMHHLLTGDSFYFVYKNNAAKQSDIIKLGRWLKQQCFE